MCFLALSYIPNICWPIRRRNRIWPVLFGVTDPHVCVELTLQRFDILGPIRTMPISRGPQS
jgi:hypothetical protein